MASYQVDMPDGSSYQVELPETNSKSVQPKQEQPSTVDTVHNTLSNIGEGATNFVNKVGEKSELGQVPNLDTAKELVKSPIYGAMNAYDTVKGVADKYLNNYSETPGTPYAESDFHKNLDEANSTRKEEIKNTPYGGTADFAGQLLTPMPELNLIGKAAKGASMLAKGASTVGRGAEKVASGAAQGATFAAEQPKPATNNSEDLANQAEQTLSSGAIAGGAVGGAAAGVSKAKSWYDIGKSWITKASIEKSTGEALPEVLGKQGVQDLEAHVANPNAKDMNLTDVTQNRDIASAEKGLFKGADKNAVEERRQGVNSNIANELEHLDVTGTNTIQTPASASVGKQQIDINNKSQPVPEYKAPEIENAPTQVEAQENTGALARDISNQKRQEIKDAYKAIAPDETVSAPIEDLQTKLDDIREQGTNHDLIHGKQSEDGTPLSPPDRMLSEIDERYSSTAKATKGEDPNTASVKQMIQDKNNLGDYVSGQYNSLKNNTLTYEQQQVVQDKIKVAQQMRDALKEHLSSLDTVPSGVEDKSVSEAFNEAESKYKNYRSQFLENPEQYKVNEQGVEHGRSISSFGDYDYRLQKGTAGTLAEEGKKLLPVENPDALGATLKNMRNAEGADDLVKSNLLAAIKEKGFDKAYTPEVKTQLENNGFEGVSKDLTDLKNHIDTTNGTISDRNKLIKGMQQELQDTLEKSFAGKVVKGGDVAKLLEDKEMQTQALNLASKENDGGATTRGLGKTLLDQIKEKTISTKPNDLAAGEVKSADFEKFYDEFSKHREFLEKTLPKDQFDALTTVNKELAQNSFMERTNASAENTLAEKGVSEKLNEITIKGAISKIAGVPIGSAASLTALINKVRWNKVEAVVKDAISNPQRALELVNAAKAAPKDPSALKNFFDYAYDRLPAVAGAGGQPLDVRQNKNGLETPPKPIDKEVNDVTKPQSSNDSFSFNPISDADASEGTNSKKNNEFQIADASKATGMPKEYFNALEKAETQGQTNPDTAKAKTSSAYGRSQFTEKTWNDIATRYELPIVTDKNRLTANDPRSNAKYSRLAAGYYGSENADKLKPWLQSNQGRDTTIGDVYGAHLMGLQGFKQFISASPNTPADKVVPQAAKNNSSLFYDKSGKALSIRQVYHNIEDRLLPTTKKPLIDSTDGEPDQ